MGVALVLARLGMGGSEEGRASDAARSDLAVSLEELGGWILIASALVGAWCAWKGWIP